MAKDIPTNKEIIAILRKTYPNFSKISLSMARSSRYGVCLTADAVRTLRKIYPDFKIDSKAVFTSLTQSEKKRTKSNRVAVRMDDATYAKFKDAFEASGEKTVQDYLEKIIGGAIDDD